MQLFTIDRWPPPGSIDYRPQLEAGGILFFPITPFEFPESSKEFLRSLSFAGHAVHKNIAYRPASDRVTGIEGAGDTPQKLHAVMRQYSRNVVAFIQDLLPVYAYRWKLDYASFRPVEEEGRHLPINKRNDLIHTDAFPSRPTNGDLILRVFTNIHSEKARVWVTSNPFRELAQRYARDAGLEHIAKRASSSTGKLMRQSAGILSSMGLPLVARSPYDQFMLEFHEYLKRNTDFQQNGEKFEFEFPASSTWMCFTDVVPHSVKSGQHAVEQTFIVSRQSMADPAAAPVAILESICGRALLT